MFRLTSPGPLLGRRYSAAAVLLALPLAACQPSRSETSVFGDTRRGAHLVAALGCGACHTIPGIANASGQVGPSLEGIADQAIIAGLLPNTPENMTAWIKAPQSIVPGNAMPNMELNDHDAKDVAAYLYTLR